MIKYRIKLAGIPKAEEKETAVLSMQCIPTIKRVYELKPPSVKSGSLLTHINSSVVSLSHSYGGIP
jgi:hypothetical protein